MALIRSDSTAHCPVCLMRLLTGQQFREVTLDYGGTPLTFPAHAKCAEAIVIDPELATRTAERLAADMQLYQQAVSRRVLASNN